MTSSASANDASFVILGAGPAGLGAAVCLARRGFGPITLVERQATVGGNAGSFDLEGMRVDYGSHRLHPSCDPRILADIKRLVGTDLLDRPRHGRIRLRGRWLHFPLKPIDLARRLPPSFVASVLRDKLSRSQNVCSPDTFASVLERGLGRTICRDFYFPYAEKIWGLPPTEIDAVQAKKRVSAGSIGGMLRKVVRAVPGLRPPGGGRFFYPRLGYGQICGAYHETAANLGVDVRLETTVTAIELRDGRVSSVCLRHGSATARQRTRHVLSTIPLPALVKTIRPAAPPEILGAADALRYRAMVLVYLALETDRFTEYDAHYFPEPSVAITRLSEPKNYGLTGPDGLTVLCAELPCAPDDEVWSASEHQLARRVMRDLETAGLPVRAPVRRVLVRRLREAYPIYDRAYLRNFEQLDAWIGQIDGLITFGRQGLFVHDNTHHALAMAYALDECFDDGGVLDRRRWAAHRRSFESHVVED
jgi:protoporphyrinogen oxidase